MCPWGYWELWTNRCVSIHAVLSRAAIAVFLSLVPMNAHTYSREVTTCPLHVTFPAFTPLLPCFQSTKYPQKGHQKHPRVSLGFSRLQHCEFVKARYIPQLSVQVDRERRLMHCDSHCITAPHTLFGSRDLSSFCMGLIVEPQLYYNIQCTQLSEIATANIVLFTVICLQERNAMRAAPCVPTRTYAQGVLILFYGDSLAGRAPVSVSFNSIICAAHAQSDNAKCRSYPNLQSCET